MNAAYKKLNIEKESITQKEKFMNNKLLVRLSNIIGIVSIILLVYWVFIFISITVFGLKVFRENMTETFYLSIFGILALMFGSLIINVMFNLTRIAEKHNQDNTNSTKTFKKLWLIFGFSFPIIFGLLFGGDYLTSKKKEQMLIASAKSIIESNIEKSDKLLNYNFNKEWIKETKDILDIYSKTDTHFPHVEVIVVDDIDNSQVFLSFRTYYYYEEIEVKIVTDSVQLQKQPQKKSYIRQTTQVERDYLNKVFFENYSVVRFSARQGRYELFYPYSKNGKKIVLYFSDYQRYGKIGS